MIAISSFIQHGILNPLLIEDAINFYSNCLHNPSVKNSDKVKIKDLLEILISSPLESARNYDIELVNTIIPPDQDAPLMTLSYIFDRSNHKIIRTSGFIKALRENGSKLLHAEGINEQIMNELSLCSLYLQKYSRPRRALLSEEHKKVELYPSYLSTWPEITVQMRTACIKECKIMKSIGLQKYKETTQSVRSESVALYFKSLIQEVSGGLIGKGLLNVLSVLLECVDTWIDPVTLNTLQTFLQIDPTRYAVLLQFITPVADAVVKRYYPFMDSESDFVNLRFDRDANLKRLLGKIVANGDVIFDDAQFDGFTQIALKNENAERFYTWFVDQLLTDRTVSAADFSLLSGKNFLQYFHFLQSNLTRLLSNFKWQNLNGPVKRRILYLSF